MPCGLATLWPENTPAPKHACLWPPSPRPARGRQRRFSIKLGQRDNLRQGQTTMQHVVDRLWDSDLAYPAPALQLPLPVMKADKEVSWRSHMSITWLCQACAASTRPPGAPTSSVSGRQVAKDSCLWPRQRATSTSSEAVSIQLHVFENQHHWTVLDLGQQEHLKHLYRTLPHEFGTQLDRGSCRGFHPGQEKRPIDLAYAAGSGRCMAHQGASSVCTIPW